MRRGLAESRERAQEAITAGRVTVGGAPAAKVARMVSAADAVAVHGPPARFVSRGGDKLEAALERFAVHVAGHRALDAGSSTGGFTDCLLQRGASSVVAVDVGRGQLHERLRRDPAVVSRERTHVRDLRLGDVDGDPVSIVVADLSFISLRGVASVLVGDIAAPGAAVVVLVKPQFEAGRAEVSRGRGVIRDPEVWREALVGVASALRAAGAAIMGAMVSPLKGADGNVEFLLYALAHTTARAEPDLDAVIAEAAEAAAPPRTTATSAMAKPGERDNGRPAGGGAQHVAEES